MRSRRTTATSSSATSTRTLGPVKKFTYQHATGQPFDTSTTAPVIAVKFSRGTLPGSTTNQTAQIVAKVNTGVADNTGITNTASSCADQVSPCTAPPIPPTTTVQEPVLALVKTVKDSTGTVNLDGGTAKPGATLVYGATYTNNGHGAASGVVLTDTIPANTTYVAGTTTGAGTTMTFQHAAGGLFDNSDAGTVIAIKWTVTGTVAASGGTGTIGFQVKIN